VNLRPRRYSLPVTDRTLPATTAPGTPWLLYLGLGLVVWGLFVPDQGLWHDDVQNLFRAFVAPERGEGLFPMIATPTRRLLGLPFIAALATGWPVQTLHLLCAAAWIATAFVADRLARRLWPAAPLAAPLAGALTVCATPDLSTAAALAVGYQQSVVLYLCAALLGLAWLQSGSRAALWAAPAALCASLWTTDAAVAAWPLTPLLWAAAPGARGRRAVPLGVLWFVAPVPYVITFFGLISGEGSYLRRALVPFDADLWLARVTDLLAWNVTPWRWAMDRPQWFPPRGSVVPPSVRWTIALGAGALAAWALFRRARWREGAGLSGEWAALASVALMVAANAPFVGVQYAELYYRTHLLSRVFASMALAWLTAVAWSRARGAARVALAAAVAAWLSLGVSGALERQDYFVAYTRAHRQELSSILTAAPGLAPDTVLLLRAPAHPGFLATEAEHLARAWTSLLYADSSLECRTALWSATGSTGCDAAGTGFVCRGERSPDCGPGERHERLIPYEKVVLLEYRPAENRYVLAETLPPGSPEEAGYRPHERIRPAPRTTLAHALLDTTHGLAAWLWP
jgi:hypothetical protein